MPDAGVLPGPDAVFDPGVPAVPGLEERQSPAACVGGAGLVAVAVPDFEGVQGRAGVREFPERMKRFEVDVASTRDVDAKTDDNDEVVAQPAAQSAGDDTDGRIPNRPQDVAAGRSPSEWPVTVLTGEKVALFLRVNLDVVVAAIRSVIFPVTNLTENGGCGGHRYSAGWTGGMFPGDSSLVCPCDRRCGLTLVA